MADPSDNSLSDVPERPQADADTPDDRPSELQDPEGAAQTRWLPPSRRDALRKQVKTGANWLYFIAGLSLVNVAVFHFRGNVRFVVGLGYTTVLGILGEVFRDVLGPGATVVVVTMQVGISVVFAMFGVFAGKGHAWALVVGMLLYGADTFLFVVEEYWLSVGFHVLALVFMFRGLRACRELTAMDPDFFSKKPAPRLLPPLED